MRRALIFRSASLSLLFVALCHPAFGQKITGDITGTVTDSTGAVLPNVTVTAVNAGTNFSRSGVSSDAGAFRIPELPIGTYKVTASAEGFKSTVQTVDVLAGSVIQASFKLTIGQRNETVEVEGTAPLVELSPNNNNYVDSEKIANVPLNGRDFNSLLAITPGVQRAPGGGFLAVSINGSRTTSNNYFIDGLYNNDRYYGDSAINQTGILGIPAVTFPPDAIEELSVQETPSAEFGVKGGAPILLNMKSGTNTWHGGATWINHNGIGDADNYFSNHNSDNCASPGECKPTPIHNNQFHANIGGPIVKDKAFFFLFYEGQRYKSSAVGSRAVPKTSEVAAAEADIATNGLTIDPVGQTLLNFFPITDNGIHHVDYRDFGPHIGFSWDIFGNSRMALRGGSSLSYDVANFGALASPYNFAHAHTGVFTQLNLGFFNQTNSAPNDQDLTAADNTLGSGCYDPNTGVGSYICFDSAVAGPLFGSNASGTPPFNAFSVVQNFKTPRYHNINLSLQTELFRNNVLTIAYSGQRGRDLIIYSDLNASPIGTPSASDPMVVCSSPSDCDPSRPLAASFPDLRHVIQASNAGGSQYDSLQASYNQRNWHGLDTQYNLTWSKCFDDNSVNRGGYGDYPQINNSNPVGSTALAHPNFADSRGLCDHDVRLNFNVSGVYEVPPIPHLGQRFGKGWAISTVYTALAGRPFSAVLSGSGEGSGQGLIGNSIRAAWDGSPVHYSTRNPDAYVTEIYAIEDQADPCGRVGGDDPANPGHTLGGLPVSPFYRPCDGAVGNSRRNQFIGPGLSQWDMSLIKNTKITERLSVELRWEVYNLFNRANFHYLPDNTFLGSCNTVLPGGGCAASEHAFGTIVKTSDVAAGNPVIAQGGPRNMNFSLRFTF